MLKLIVEAQELFNNDTQEFLIEELLVLHLEHSLVSLSKWEQKFEVPFLTLSDKTSEQVQYYVECMVISPEVTPEILSKLNSSHYKLINEYIDSKQSATTFGSMPEQKGRGETITAELVYYWMIAFQIPYECQYWHLNRLFALVRICNIKNSKPKKMSRKEMQDQREQLNRERREKYNTNG